MTDFKLIIFFSVFVFCSHAQNDTSLVKNANTKTLKKLGKSALLQNDPQSAITFFEAYNKKIKSDADATKLLGDAYLQSRDYERAQRTYLRAYKLSDEKSSESLYYHAQMMKSNGQYDSAKINFQKFKKEYRGKNKEIKKQATREIVFCDSVHRLIKVEKKIIITHLDTSINKVHVEAGPANYADDELVFTSFRTDQKEYEIENGTEKGLKRKLYVAKRKNDKWKFVGEFAESINDDDFHTGNASFSADRKRVYFTRCKLNYMEKMVCAIYVSTKEGDTWSAPVKLPKEVNNAKYTSTMPAVTVDAVKRYDMIYFVSDRKGGKGKLDIWYTIYNEKTKKYSVPKNAGSKVNSIQDEISPFFDTETRTLYFSSKGWGGLGGFDIFKTTGDGKRWTGIQNIGTPINTGADDIYYTISTNRQEGFFVSNRKGGNSLKNSTCCDDIYHYKRSEYIRLTLKGNVSDITDRNVPIANAMVEIFIVDKKTKEKFFVKKVAVDEFGDYETNVEPGYDYFLVVKKDDYLGTSIDVTTDGINTSGDVKQDLQMVKKPKTPIQIPNIKYQFDRSEIEPNSKLVLDTTVLKLMENNPELVIEIMAHTDGKGSDAYNLKLSQKRAESIVKYLVSKGVDAKRLKAKGYGESMPVAPNENPDGSDNPENRARNRRTDFKIIGVIDAEIIRYEME